MRTVEALATLSLRPLLNGPPAVDFWARHWQDHAAGIRGLLHRALERAWRTLEVTLAGPAWWERAKLLLQPGEDTAIGERVQVFLDSAPLTAPGNGNDWRGRALTDLRAARQQGLLTATDSVGWETLRDAGPDSDVLQALAGQLRQAGFAGLADVLAQPAVGADRILAAAAGYFCRREMEADAELSRQLAAAGLAAPAADAPCRFDALGEVLTAHADRLEALLAAGPSTQRAGDPLDLEREAKERGEPVAGLAHAVLPLLKRHKLLGRELRLSDSGTLRAPEERQRLRELLARFGDLDPETQRAAPALLNGLALLEAAAADYDGAHRDFQAAAAGVTDPHALAVLEYNAYVAALEQRDWAEALALLERAATLWPERFSPFPLAQYEPERILGVGASGIAFLCRHRPSDSHVVIKSLWLDGLAHDAEHIFRETQTLEGINHAAMVRLSACDYAGPDQTRPYLVGDYFEGWSLAEVLQQHGPLSPADTLRIARPLAEALQAAHEQGVLHRTVKPANVLINQDETGWKIKLIDFGLAVKPTVLHATLIATPAGDRPAVAASALGTMSYDAPEEVGWVDGVPIGAYSDVYSFGKVCYFALLGTPEPDDDEKATLPPAWRKLLGHCTARSIARRPPSFRVVLPQLAHLQAAPVVVVEEKKPAEAPAAAAKLSRAEQERVLDLINKGTALKQHGDLDRALAAFTRALQIDPNLAGGYIKRGNVHSDRGDYDKAIADYATAIKLEPKNALAYNNRGLANAKKGDIDAVLVDCGQALKLDPKLASAHFFRGNAYATKGDLTKAIAEYNLGLRLEPRNALAYNGRGMVHADAGAHDKALLDYTAALRLEPRLTLAYVNRGIAFRHQGNPDRAIQEFTKALRLEPRNVPALFNRGLAFLDRHAYDHAAAAFEKVLQLDPKHPEAAQRRDEAIKARKAAAPAAGERRVKPTPPSRAQQDALRLARAKNNQEEERRQVRAAAYFARGRTFFEQKEYNQAIDQFTKAIQMDPKDAQAYYNRGLAYVAQGEHQEAIADLTSALHLNPKNALAYYHRGIAHRHIEEFDRAISDYTRALRVDPRLALAYRNRGQVWAAKGDSDRARADYDEAVRLDPALAKK